MLDIAAPTQLIYRLLSMKVNEYFSIFHFYQIDKKFLLKFLISFGHRPQSSTISLIHFNDDIYMFLLFCKFLTERRINVCLNNFNYTFLRIVIILRFAKIIILFYKYSNFFIPKQLVNIRQNLSPSASNTLLFHLFFSLCRPFIYL